jgi:hypothetical protein
MIVILGLFLLSADFPACQSTSHHQVRHKLNAVNLFFLFLLINLLTKVLNKVKQVIVLSGSDSVVIYSKKYTLNVFLGTEPKQQLTKFKRGPTASFPSKHIDILD